MARCAHIGWTKDHVTYQLDVTVPLDADGPITVEDVGSAIDLPGTQRTGQVSDVASSYRLNGQGPRQSLEDGPIVAQPGDSLFVTVVNTFAKCEHSPKGVGRTYEDIPVTYAVSGESGTERLPLGYALTVVGGPQCTSTSTSTSTS